MSFMRLVACLALDLLAEKRRTKACSSWILSLARALADDWRSRAMVDASM